MLQINQYLNEAIQKIENDKQREIQVAKEKVYREKISVHDAEIDQYKTNALAELQKQYESDRAEIIKKSEENKQAYANNEVEIATALVIAQYDEKIKKLEELIIKE